MLQVVARLGRNGKWKTVPVHAGLSVSSGIVVVSLLQASVWIPYGNYILYSESESTAVDTRHRDLGNRIPDSPDFPFFSGIGDSPIPDSAGIGKQGIPDSRFGRDRKIFRESGSRCHDDSCGPGISWSGMETPRQDRT